MTLRRKTPLKRTALKRKPPKRKLGRFKRPLRNATPKRAKRNREVKPFRIKFLKSLNCCEYCGRVRPWNEYAPHEIASGTADRKKAQDRPFAMLGVCQLECHDKVQNENKPRQLARLLLSRPHDFDLVAFNRLRGRADEAIALDDVLSHCSVLSSSKAS